MLGDSALRFFLPLGSRPAIFGLVLALTSAGRGDDWPQWRGPARDGVWRERGILDKFPAGGPRVVWRAPIGPGYTGPAVAGDRVFLMDRRRAKDENGEDLLPQDGAILGTERVICLNAKDGATLWEREYDAAYRIYFPLGPRTTPAVDGERVYTLGAMGRLLCCDVATGAVRWSKDFAAEYSAKPPIWGWSANLLVTDANVIALVGGEGSAVVAFDKHTGEERWRALSAEEIGYSSPMVIEAGGRRQLIVWLDSAIHSLDEETGKPLWSHNHPASGEPRRPVVNSITPAWSDPWLMISEHYQGSLMLKLAGDAPEVVVQWRTKNENPARPDDLNSIFATPVIRDGLVFGFTSSGVLRCLRAETGAVLWETLEATGSRRQDFLSAYLIPQGDRCFLFNDQGDLIIARLTDRGYEEIDRTHLLDPTSYGRGRNVVWSHPAFAHRSVFARNDKEIICASLADGAPAEVAGTAETEAGDSASRDLKRMQGEWRPVSGERDGQPIPERELRRMSRKVEGNSFAVTVESEEAVLVLKGTFTLDVSASPRAIDAVRSEGPSKDKVMRGIYEFDGNQIRICLAPPEAERPKEMATKPGTGQTMIVWRPAKGAPASKSAAAEKLDPRVVDIVRQVSKLYRDAKSLSCRSEVTSRTTSDAASQEVNVTATWNLARPNRLDMRMRIPGQPEGGLDLVCDGQEFVALARGQKRYTRENAPKDFAALGQAVVRYGHVNTGALFQNILHVDPAAMLLDGVTECRYAGEDKVGETPAHHLAFTQPDMTWELWVAAKGPSFVLRFTTQRVGAFGTHTTDETHTEWKVDVAPQDEAFKLVLPEDAVNVERLAG